MERIFSGLIVQWKKSAPDRFQFAQFSSTREAYEPPIPEFLETDCQARKEKREEAKQERREQKRQETEM